MKGLRITTLAACAVALLAGCVTPQGALDEKAKWKGRIIEQINSTSTEDENDYKRLAEVDAEDAWAEEAEKYWVRAHRKGETSATLTTFVQESAEATRKNLSTAERRRALRVQKHRNSALAVDTLDKMTTAERAQEEWLKLLLPTAPPSTEPIPEVTSGEE